MESACNPLQPRALFPLHFYVKLASYKNVASSSLVMLNTDWML